MVFLYLSEMNFNCVRLLVIVLMHTVVLRTHGYAQQFQDAFYEQWERQDTTGMLSFLNQWKKAEPYNPDVYVGFFNYYAIQTFEEETLLLTEMPQDGGEYLEVRDSLNNLSGYLSSQMVINDSILNIAFDWVDQGIARFPDRLDLRMGKVYLAVETDRMDLVRSGLQSAILSGDSIHHEWKWMREEVLDSGQYFLYSSVQGHLYELFEKQDSIADDIILGISQLMLQQDDQQYFAMTNIATLFMIKKQFSLAIDWLKKADKIHEKDPIILSNLGYCYGELQEWKKARRCYEEAMKWSDAAGREYCQRQLDGLLEQERK